MTQPRGYVDPHYLDVSAERLKQNKQRTYTWMHIQPGHAVLDVGCGPGTDTIVLAGLIGPIGRVVGVDSDAAMIAEADRRAEQAGCSAWCHHQQGDALALPLETCAFEAWCSERLFQHVHNPAGVLAEMARVTKPGGWVVVWATDWGTLSIDTPEVDIERRLVRVKAERHVNNGYAGRQLYGLFKRQQFADIAVEIHPVSITDYTLFRYASLMDAVERDALATGLVTEEDFIVGSRALKRPKPPERSSPMWLVYCYTASEKTRRLSHRQSPLEARMIGRLHERLVLLCDCSVSRQ